MGTGDMIQSILKKKKVEAQVSKFHTPVNTSTTTQDIKNPIETLPGYIDFIPFCRWTSYPSYPGLFWWQKDCWEEIKDVKYSEILVPREHGKSVVLGDVSEWLLQYADHDILYLGWTDRRKEVSENVCNFFEAYDQIDEKRSSFHFTLKNGGKFDCYLIKSKDILGMHSKGDQSRFNNLTEEEVEQLKEYYKEFNESVLEEFLKNRSSERKLCIIIDDPIDDSFYKERHKEEALERRFMSTIYNINPDKWIFTGTKKFTGDFFDFIERTFKGRLTRYVRKTHLEPGQKGYDRDPVNNPNNLLCPEQFTEKGMPNYERDRLPYKVDKDGKPLTDEKGKRISKPAKRDLTEIYESLKNSGRLYWWFAEYEQDPHPITGEVWEELGYVDFLDTPYVRHYDLLWITIDRATTRKIEANKKEADYTGCVVGLREYDTGRRVITNDWTGYIDIDELLLRINNYVIEHRMRYEHMDILIVVETQGGGSDFVTLVRNMPEFTTKDTSVLDSDVIKRFAKEDPTTNLIRIPNRLREYCTIEEVSNRGEKESRIRDRLNAPINTKRLVALRNLQHSEVITELLDFPHCEKFDAADALANAEFVILQKYPVVAKGKSRADDMLEVYRKYERGTLENEVEVRDEDEIGPLGRAFMQKFGKQKERRRSVFD